MGNKQDKGNKTTNVVVSTEATAAELAAVTAYAESVEYADATAVEQATIKATAAKATAEATAAQLADAVTAGNFTLAAQLAKKAANEKILANLAAAQLADAVTAANEVETVNIAAAELAAQLVGGAGNFTLSTLWSLINATVPAAKAAKAAKATKATKAAKATTADATKVTKLSLTLETVSDGLGTLDELTKKFVANFPDDNDAENHAKQYLAKYAKKVGDFYAAK